MKRVLPVLAVLAACSGKTELPPHGEALFYVDTDVPVPQLAGRLRVDLYDERGSWFESRDVGRADPRAFPASFSVYADDDTRDKLVMVRLRLYPEGIVRDYQGESYEPRPTFTEPEVAASLAELCASAPELPVGGRVTARRGGTPITKTIANERCTAEDHAGSIAARVVIAKAGAYRFSVANAFPYTSEATLALRRTCDDASSQLACDAERNANVTFPGHFPRVDATLDPGTYWLVTSGSVGDWPADLTLEALSLDDPPPDAPAPETPRDASSPPRLRQPGTPDGARDETPVREPLPSVTIDRLVLVRLRPGVRGAVRLTMRGACAGTAARLGADPRVPASASAATCIDHEDELAPLAETPLDPDMDRQDPSAVGTFGAAATCEGLPGSGADRACIPGGAFVLGSRALGAAPGTLVDTVPERLALMPRFFLDRHEVTVGRMRAAVARGFAVDETNLHANDLELAAGGFCTWSALRADRDGLPVNCIGWRLARAFCRFEGGDLPTEAQWEYVALAAGRPFKTLQPWGDEEPDCTRAVVARAPSARVGDTRCVSAGLPVGPAEVQASDRRDVSPSGVVGLSGNVSEWTLDSAASYASACWRAAPLRSPRCWEENAPMRVARGGSWTSGPSGVLARTTSPGVVAGAGYGKWQTPRADIGFRCAYEEPAR